MTEHEELLMLREVLVWIEVDCLKAIDVCRGSRRLFDAGMTLQAQDTLALIAVRGQHE